MNELANDIMDLLEKHGILSPCDEDARIKNLESCNETQREQLEKLQSINKDQEAVICRILDRWPEAHVFCVKNNIPVAMTMIIWHSILDYAKSAAIRIEKLQAENDALRCRDANLVTSITHLQKDLEKRDKTLIARDATIGELNAMLAESDHRRQEAYQFLRANGCIEANAPDVWQKLLDKAIELERTVTNLRDDAEMYKYWKNHFRQYISKDTPDGTTWSTLDALIGSLQDSVEEAKAKLAEVISGLHASSKTSSTSE